MGKGLTKPQLLEKDLEFLAASTHLSIEEIMEWYDKFATDAPDGKLQPHHMIEMYRHLFPGNEGYTKLIIKAMDTDGDGAVDFQEFLRGMDTATNGTLEDKLHLIFKMYDKNNDGVLDLKELVDVMSVLQDDAVQEAAESMMKKLDVNKDGTITEEEFLAATKKC